MKVRLAGSRYVVGLTVSLLLILGPILFALLLNIPSIIYPNDCDVALRCEHAIVRIAASLGFGLIFLGPVLMLIGLLILIVIGFVWGICTFKGKKSEVRQGSFLKKIIGLACFGMLLFLLYIPSSPDQCSRVISDTQYEVCLEDIFADMTIAETRQWLVENDFKVYRILKTDTKRTRAHDTRHADNLAFSYDVHFQAFRDRGKFRSVPYGTNFNRFFARIGPAPDRFELNIFGSDEGDRVVAVNVWWAFSFF